MEPRNLVLVHTPGLQARKDFERIAEKARRIDPDVSVYIADNDVRSRRFEDEIATRPTLVFSPIRLKQFTPKRGALFHGGAIDKLRQYERFVAQGISTPKTALLTRATILSEADWGDYVVLKPLAFDLQSTGRSVYLIRTARLNHDIHIEGMFDRYDLRGGVIVQQFVNTGPDLEYHRVLALFGEPLYVMRTRVLEPVEFDEKAHVNGTIPVANLAYSLGEKTRDFVSGEDFFSLAKSCYAAFPERALQAVDILKSRVDGRLYVIETNLGGNTWHFSSTFLKKRNHDEATQRKMTEAKIKQFGAFDVAARVLVEQTRLHAA
jgi:hypothetical protein